MTKDHPLHGLMDIAMEKIKELVDSNTIIGEPITMADGTLILPVSKVSFGFASGGSDFPSPVAFLVIRENGVKLLQLASQESNTTDRIINALPDVLDKLQELFQKDKTGGTQE